jgi:thiamine-phosphate pyrophosphorylase
MTPPARLDVRTAVRGFYAVLDRHDAALARALVAHARVLQVRLKPAGDAAPAPTADWLRVAKLARAITREAGAALVIDDRLDVALAAEADGVHLGQADLPLADARWALRGRPLWIGVSTHDLAQVRDAVAGGADYLGFGPVFATATKANPDPVRGLPLLAAAVRAAGSVPVVAIGGITADTAAAVAATGAAAAAVIGAVTRAVDPGTEAARISAAWAPRQ